MTKTYCDRCGADITVSGLNRVKVTVNVREEVNGEYCDSCRYDIVHSADPLPKAKPVKDEVTK